MLTKEENDLLTQTGSGTPMGNLIRRFWQPAALSEELPPGAPPLSLRLLDEDLVLFRDNHGRPGLLGNRCSHRGVDLSYGRVEDGGLRCIYHGWLYDIHGHCLEQPGEPTESEFHIQVRHLAYPCREMGGIIFTYMGPGTAPQFPKYEPLTVPQENRHIEKFFVDCNYLQSFEGGVDPSHVSYLHRSLRQDDRVDRFQRLSVKAADDSSSPDLLKGAAENLTPAIDAEVSGLGLRMFSFRPLGPKSLVRITTNMLPNSSAVPGATAADGYTLAWHVPVDDTHTCRYSVHFTRSRPMDKEARLKMSGPEATKDYRPIRNMDNRYLQNREEMKTSTYSGFGHSVPIQDVVVVQLQGTIQDRTQERLGYTDRALVTMRLLLLKAVRDLGAGREVDSRPLPVVISESIPASEDWRSYAKRRIEELEAASLRVMQE